MCSSFPPPISKKPLPHIEQIIYSCWAATPRTCTVATHWSFHESLSLPSFLFLYYEWKEKAKIGLYYYNNKKHLSLLGEFLYTCAIRLCDSLSTWAKAQLTINPLPNFFISSTVEKMLDPIITFTYLKDEN